MDTKRRHLLCALLIIALSSLVGAENPPPVEKPAPPATTVTAECRMFIVPDKSALALIPQLSDENSTAAAIAQLEALVKAGQAKLFASLLCQTTLDETATASSGEDVKYAQDFSPPQLPESGADPKTIAKWPFVGVVPSSFASQRTGPSLEIDLAATSDSKFLRCSYKIEHVRLERMNKIEAGRFANGERLFIEQPVFSTLSSKATCPIQIGQPKLVGLHRPPGVEAAFELFILTVRSSQ